MRQLAPLYALLFILSIPAEARADAPRYANPIVRQRADPWVWRHTDGFYYFTASVPEFDRIELRRSRTIQGLGQAEAHVVWRKHETGVMSENIWAPEIHFIGGAWYIYFAAARRDAPFDHRIYVLSNDSPDPREGGWTEKGQIATDWASFSLDATEFALGGKHYLVWAQRDPHLRGNSNLYIASMVNPWRLSSRQVLISRPELPWERRGYWVNEGPAVLQKNGRIFLTYSASATDASYCMGMLTASADADPLEPSSWSKSPVPVLSTDEAAGIYGPGHNSFTVDGDFDVLVYHARAYRDIAGDPLRDPNRDTRAQVVRWNGDGSPAFAPPQ
jgi:GH43 family beta-xylosidase